MDAVRRFFRRLRNRSSRPHPEGVESAQGDSKPRLSSVNLEVKELATERPVKNQRQRRRSLGQLLNNKRAGHCPVTGRRTAALTPAHSEPLLRTKKSGATASPGPAVASAVPIENGGRRRFRKFSKILQSRKGANPLAIRAKLVDSNSNWEVSKDDLTINLDDKAIQRRSEILDVLLEFDLIGREEKQELTENPRRPPDHRVDSTDLCNYFRFPSIREGGHNHQQEERAISGACFTNYLNFGCWGGDSLRRLLESPVRIAVNDVTELSCVLAVTAKVKDMLGQGQNRHVYYSFCFGRGVMSRDAVHCPWCRKCVGGGLEHCFRCGKCCYGLKMGGGKCEHCVNEIMEPAFECDDVLPTKKSAVSIDNLSDITWSTSFSSTVFWPPPHPATTTDGVGSSSYYSTSTPNSKSRRWQAAAAAAAAGSSSCDSCRFSCSNYDLLHFSCERTHSLGDVLDAEDDDAYYQKLLDLEAKSAMF